MTDREGGVIVAPQHLLRDALLWAVCLFPLLLRTPSPRLSADHHSVRVLPHFQMSSAGRSGRRRLRWAALDRTTV